jgi:ABC-type branched-chain amino acid transport systems, periplasmic component
MTVTNKLLGALAGVAVAAAALPALAQKTIALGYQAPLTGEMSQYGEVFRNSATMAVEQFNKSGKLPGATVVLKFEDSKNDAKEGVNIAKKFVDDQEIVGVLGDFSSTVSMAAAQVYAQAGVPQLSQTASHPDYVKISEWQFRNITTQAFEGPFVAKWALGEGKKKIAVIAIQNDWGQSVVSNFKDAVEKNGGQVTTVEFYNPGNRDFRTILTKVAREKPDAIYLGMFDEDGASLLQQRRQLNIQTPTYATSSLYSPKLIALAGPASDGLKLSTTFASDSPEPVVKAYVDEYKTRYKADPTMFAAQAFDATNIMLAAIAKVGPDVTRKTLRDALAQTTAFPGVTGETTFDPQTREPTKQLARMEIKGGQFALVK